MLCSYDIELLFLPPVWCCESSNLTKTTLPSQMADLSNVHEQLIKLPVRTAIEFVSFYLKKLSLCESCGVHTIFNLFGMDICT